MKIGPFTLFQRMHSNGTPCNSYNIAALHWRDSITWRWNLTWSPWYRRPGNQGFSFMRTHRGRGWNFMLCFNAPLLGHWSLQTQPNMWRNL